MYKFYFLLYIISATQFCTAQSHYQNPKPTGADLYSVHFIDSQQGFIGGDDGLFKTNDGGESWYRVRAVPDSIREIFFLDQHTGWYAGKAGKIYYTTDSGDTWRLYSAINGYSISSIYFHSQMTGYAGASGGALFKTTDGGITWEKSVLGSQGSNISCIIFTSPLKGWAGEDNNNNLWYTTNAGELWQIKGTPGPGTTQEVFFTPEGEIGYACGWNNRFVKTTNGGTNWSEVPVLPPPHRATFHNVFFTDDLKGWLLSYAGQFGNLFKTTDGGVSWQYSFIRYGKLTDISFPTESTGYIVGGSGLIAKTTDGGINWIVLTRGTWHHFYHSQFYNKDIGWAAGFRQRVLGVYYYSNVIVRTTDGGNNWEEIPSPYFQRYQDLFFASDKIGWITAFGGILKTTDGGETWFPLSVPYQIYRSIYFLDENTGWTVGQHGSQGILMYTSDGGETWINKKYFSNYVNTAIWFIDLQTGFINYGSGIYKTTDGGLTWENCLITPTTINTGLYTRDIFFIKDSLGFASGSYRFSPRAFVVKTTDQGTTWQVTNEELFGSGSKIEFIDEYNGYLIGVNSSLYFTTNQGINWIKSGEYGNTVSFVSKDEGWLFGDDGKIKKFTSPLTDIEVPAAGIEYSDTYLLYQNYPNPFNTSTTIHYSVPNGTAAKVNLIIYDILGKEIDVLVNEEKPPGEYKLNWNARGLSSGVYILRMQAGSFYTAKKLLMMK
jgi:photosystem II stability/assembly factor-like uncharacterized protein